MPVIGLGTWQLEPEEAYNATLTALKLGYRHVDTAAVYKNEADVGRAIRDSGIPREQIFVTTKLYPIDAGYKGKAAFERSLKTLGLDYVDLYLMHWPGAYGGDYAPAEVLELRMGGWKAMSEAYRAGKAKSIGVSNFLIRHLEPMVKLAAEGALELPMINQVEYHPYLYQPELVKFCQTHKIVFEPYCSLGSGDKGLMQEPAVKAAAAAHKKTEAQVLLRWAVQQEMVIIPRSRAESRLLENANVFDFELTKAEMDALASFKVTRRVCWDPNTVP